MSKYISNPNKNADTVFGAKIKTELSADGNGLLMLAMPTGAGKTYSAARSIADFLIAGGKRKIYYIAPQRKHLNEPYDDICRFLCEAGREDLVDSVLFLKSQTDHILLNLFDNRGDLRKNVVKDVEVLVGKTKMDPFYQLCRVVRDYCSLAGHGLDTGSGLADKLKDDIRERYGELRKEIIAVFNRDCSKEFEKRRNAKEKDIDFFEVRASVFNRPKYCWVKGWYPESAILESKVVILTAAKFFSYLSPIVFDSTRLIDWPDAIYDSVIIADEIDEIYTDTQKYIINLMKDSRVAIISTFCELASHLESNELPQKFLENIPQKKLEYIKKEHEKIITDIYSLRKKYNLDHVYDYRDDTEFSSRFIFNSRFLSFGSRSKEKYVAANIGPGDNYIYFTAERPEPNVFSSMLIDLMKETRKIFSFFYNAAVAGSKGFSNGNGRELHDEMLSLFSAFKISSPGLRELILNNASAIYRRPKMVAEIDAPVLPLPYFIAGFFLQLLGKDILTSAYNIDVTDASVMVTPERIFLSLVDRAKVIGVSATCTISQSVSNFDFDTFRIFLGSKFKTFSASENKEIRHKVALLENECGNYDKVDFGAEVFDVPHMENGEVDWFQLVKDCPNGQDVADNIFILCQRCGLLDVYAQENVYKVVNRIDSFARDPDVFSLLYLAPRFYLKSSPVGGNYRDAVLGVAQLVAEAKKYEFDPDMFIQLGSADYAVKFKIVRFRLEAGKKCFVFSSIQIVALGVNLTYKVPDMLKDKVVRLNGRESDEKDFDILVIERPTYIFSVGGGDNKNVDRVDIASNIKRFEDFLTLVIKMRIMVSYGALSKADFTGKTQDAWITYVEAINRQNGLSHKLPKFFPTGDLETLLPVRRSITRQFIQILGRMQRRPWRNLKRRVYVDSALLPLIDLDVLETADLVVSGETAKVFDDLKNYCAVCVEVDSCIHDNDSLTIHAGKREAIAKFFHQKRKSSGIQKDPSEEEELVEIRRQLIRMYDLILRIGVTHDMGDLVGVAPADAALCRMMQGRFYFYSSQPSDKYYWLDDSSANKAYKDTRIYLDKDRIPPAQPGISGMVREESARTLRLRELMAIPGLRDYFVSRGYKTEVVPGRYIMRPAVVTEFYKLALGETAAKFIFNFVFGITFGDIIDPLDYERFDFVIEGPIGKVYVDIKFWVESTMRMFNVSVDWALQKADQVGAGIVLYANILADSASNFVPSDKTFISPAGREVKIVSLPAIYRFHSDGTVVLDAAAYETINVLKRSVGL